MTIYQFAFHNGVQPLENYKGIAEYILHEKLSNVEDLTEEEKLRLVFSSSNKVYKYHGYAYDFREFLTEYWVETEHYGILKFWAWNKSILRKSGQLQGLGKIGRIVEIN